MDTFRKLMPTAANTLTALVGSLFVWGLVQHWHTNLSWFPVIASTALLVVVFSSVAQEIWNQEVRWKGVPFWQNHPYVPVICFTGQLVSTTVFLIAISTI